MYRFQEPMSESKKGAGARNTGKRTPDEKLRLVIESAACGEEEIGTLLRREGLHDADLQAWRNEALAGLKPVTGSGKKSDEAKRIRSLENELSRKDEALAEMAALITLQKKVRAIWGDADDNTPTVRKRPDLGPPRRSSRIGSAPEESLQNAGNRLFARSSGGDAKVSGTTAALALIRLRGTSSRHRNAQRQCA